MRKLKSQAKNELTDVKDHVWKSKNQRNGEITERLKQNVGTDTGSLRASGDDGPIVTHLGLSVDKGEVGYVEGLTQTLLHRIDIK